MDRGCLIFKPKRLSKSEKYLHSHTHYDDPTSLWSFNAISYGEGGSRVIPDVLKLLTLQPSNCLTFRSYLLSRFWLNFSKINKSAATERSDEFGDKNLCFAWKPVKCIWRYYVGPRKTFSGIKYDFLLLINADFWGVNIGLQWLVPSSRRKICDIISPEIEKIITQTLALVQSFFSLMIDNVCDKAWLSYFIIFPPLGYGAELVLSEPLADLMGKKKVRKVTGQHTNTILTRTA